jgi:hypothetical protein
MRAVNSHFACEKIRFFLTAKSAGLNEEKHMDGNHAFGCTLIGLALTTLLVRLFWMASPPFSNWDHKKVSTWKTGLVASTALLFAGGTFLLNLPVDPDVANQIADESFRFN